MEVVAVRNGEEEQYVVNKKNKLCNITNHLTENYKNLPYPGRIYAHKIVSESLDSVEYWVISSKEAKDQELIETATGLIPESLIKYEVSDYLSVGIFQDIIDNLLDNNSQISISDTDAVNKAINHYLEYDDFL